MALDALLGHVRTRIPHHSAAIAPPLDAMASAARRVADTLVAEQRATAVGALKARISSDTEN